jgi:hypothetical protein
VKAIMARKNHKDGIDCQAYADYMRPHTPAERAALQALIRANGCDPLTVGAVNGKRYLIDGFQRKAICDAEGIPYETREIVFESEEHLPDWIERNARGRRNQTRTERNYYIGCRYLREKKGHGERGPEKKEVKTFQVFSDSAGRIAAEEKCSDRHVMNCARMAGYLNDLCGRGFAFLKWPILTERIKYGRKLLAELDHLGAGGCQKEIETLLGQNDEVVKAKQIRKALGISQELAEESNGRNDSLPVSLRVLPHIDQVWKIARGLETPTELREVARALKELLNNIDTKLEEVGG